MNAVERALLYSVQRVPTARPRSCDGPRLAPALPPGVRARQPVRTASHCPNGQGFPPAAARALRFRGPGGSVGANRLASARFASLQPPTPAAGTGGIHKKCPPGQIWTCETLGGKEHCFCASTLKGLKEQLGDQGGASGQNCPPGQIAQWVSVPGHPPQLKCGYPPIANVSEKNKPAQGAGSSTQNCPPGQIASWVSVPGHPPQLKCGYPPLANQIEKNKPAQGGSACGAACPTGQVCVCVMLGGKQHCFCDARLGINENNKNTGMSNPAGRGARFAGCPCPQ